MCILQVGHISTTIILNGIESRTSSGFLLLSGLSENLWQLYLCSVSHFFHLVVFLPRALLLM